MVDMGETQNENLSRQTTENGKQQLEVYISTTNPVYIKTQQSQMNDDMGTFEMDDMGGTEDENLRRQVFLSQQTTDDGKQQSEARRPTTNPSYIERQCLAAIAVSLGSLIISISHSYGISALLKLSSNLATQEWHLWPDVVAPIIGGVLGVPLFEVLGRKITILVTSVPLINIWLLIACATDSWTVTVGLAIVGFVSGVAFVSFHVYLVETTQPEVRGILCLLPIAFDSIGTLLWVFADRYMIWLTVAFLGGILYLLFLILLVLIPETPHWYVSKGKKESARKSLQWLRGEIAEDIESQLEDIVKSRVDSKKRGSNAVITQLFKKCNLKPLSISLGLIFFQEFSGYYDAVYYLAYFFSNTVLNPMVVYGSVSLVGNLIAIILINFLGRKKLLYISSIGMIITLSALGGFFYVEESGYSVRYIEWLRSYSLVGYFLCFSIGYEPIPYLIMLEILPTKIRGLAASLATSCGSTFLIISSKMYLKTRVEFGVSSGFWMYAVICVIGFVFAIRYVPDTHGKSLEEIERETMGRVERMSSAANIQPV